MSAAMVPAVVVGVTLLFTLEPRVVEAGDCNPGKVYVDGVITAHANEVFYEAPAGGCSYLVVKAWGGGGSEGPTNNGQFATFEPGGGGGYAEVVYEGVPAGTQFKFSAGGGAYRHAVNGFGGWASAVSVGGNVVMVAGAGGGGSSGTFNITTCTGYGRGGRGGAGGGATGVTGQNGTVPCGTPPTGGEGGAANEGGTGGDGGVPGLDGRAFDPTRTVNAGGCSVSQFYACGGDGWYGGGSGGWSFFGGGGGGGGSSHVDTSVPWLSSWTATAGSGPNPGNEQDPDRTCAPAGGQAQDFGRGGTAGTSYPDVGDTGNGFPGRVVYECSQYAGTIEFSATRYLGAESSGVAVISVVRGGTVVSSPVSVHYKAGPGGTASPGGDYSVQNGTLTFVGGERAKTFTVPLVADSTAESVETVDLSLMNVQGASTALGNRYLATLEILDDYPTCADPTTAALKFNAIEPCRLVDTRTGEPGRLVAGKSTDVVLTGRCGVPTTARALAVNVSAISPDYAGYVSVVPACVPPGSTTSVVNYLSPSSGVTVRGNNAILTLSPNGSGIVTLRSTSAADITIDVNGYYE